MGSTALAPTGQYHGILIDAFEVGFLYNSNAPCCEIPAYALVGA
jgi:hypothetical protein